MCPLGLTKVTMETMEHKTWKLDSFQKTKTCGHYVYVAYAVLVSFPSPTLGFWLVACLLLSQSLRR